MGRNVSSVRHAADRRDVQCAMRNAAWAGTPSGPAGTPHPQGGGVPTTHHQFQGPEQPVSRAGTPSTKARYAQFQVLETFMLGYYILFREREPPPLIHPRKALDDFDFPLPRIIPTEFLLPPMNRNCLPYRTRPSMICPSSSPQ